MSDTDIAIVDHLNAIADQAGLPVMGASGLLGIIWEREIFSDERLLALDADDVLNMYDAYVGPAVDGIEDYLAANDEGDR